MDSKNNLLAPVPTVKKPAMNASVKNAQMMRDPAVHQALDDYKAEDLHEIIVRNGMFLPSKCSW